ncbi:MAG: homocysteine S-methyltransferase family protein [Firmicutes bacterium]|nr:homocysteine S-methyltransferase family protein [Bacillota bacterium]
MRNFLDEIKNRILIYDGSKGYMLQKFGLKGGECPELWNVTHSDVVKKIYSLYKEAGSDVIQTNTFSGNRVQLQKHHLDDRTYELNYQGARLAREVMGEDGFVAGSAGPTGRLFEPSGDLDFETAYQIYKEQVKALVDGGVDIINFETFTDIAEMRAALLAAKETADIPVICSVSFEQNGRSLMGTDPQTAVIILKSLGADMVGTNCSFGPELMVDIVKKMHLAGGGYLSVKPNAGLPEIIDGVPVYRETAKKFAELAAQFVQYGARLIGGCCGTTPEFVSAIKENIDNKWGHEDIEYSDKYPVFTSNCTVITSGVSSFNICNLHDKNKQIGKLSSIEDEKFFKQLKDGNMEVVTDMALELASEGYDVIYINIDNENSELLAQVVNKAQGYLKQPVIIETGNPDALEQALRVYKGRAGVIFSKNASSKDKKLMDGLKNVTKRYGALIIESNLIQI